MAEEERSPTPPPPAEPADGQDQPAPAAAGEAGEAGEAEPAAAETDPEQLAALLEDARNRADEHWNQCLRLQAELDNLRKRSERDIENAHKYALDQFALELLPVRDSLEMGLAAATAAEVDPNKLKEGTELTLRMLTKAMEKFNIREIDPVGEPFDPAFHEAMSMQESAEVAPNTVLSVIQKGYLLNDRLIRPAMVIVSRAPSEKAQRVDERA